MINCFRFSRLTIIFTIPLDFVSLTHTRALWVVHVHSRLFVQYIANSVCVVNGIPTHAILSIWSIVFRILVLLEEGGRGEMHLILQKTTCTCSKDVSNSNGLKWHACSSVTILLLTTRAAERGWASLEHYSRYSITGIDLTAIRESVDSLCRDGTNTQYGRTPSMKLKDC